jgi:lysophospholipase
LIEFRASRAVRRSRAWPALALLVAATALSACASREVVTGAGYDGSLAAYRRHVEAHRRDWPIPAQLDWFRARDGARIRYARWSPPPSSAARRGVVVFFSGRTEFIEKNVATYRDLVARGFDVWTFDWRGQGLSDRMLGDPRDADKGHVDTFDTFVADAEQFIDQVVGLRDASGAKILLAHSMGGQVALRYLLAHPDVFDRAVLTSPLLRVPGDVARNRWGNAAKNGLGLATTCVVSRSPRWTSDFRAPACSLADSPEDGPLAAAVSAPEDTARYTHDWRRLAEWTCLIEESRASAPSLGLACPTSGWLRAAFRSTDVTMAERQQLRTPTLIVPARDDAAVDNAGQVQFCDETSAACCRAPEVDGAGHELLVEREPIRARVLALFDRFLASASSARAFCATLGPR